MNVLLLRGMSHFPGYVTFSRGRLTFKRVCIIFLENVTLSMVCHTFKAMSNYHGYVKLSRVCQTFKGTYVTFSRVCQTLKGMSHFQGYITLSRVCHT